MRVDAARRNVGREVVPDQDDRRGRVRCPDPLGQHALRGLLRFGLAAAYLVAIKPPNDTPQIAAVSVKVWRPEIKLELKGELETMYRFSKAAFKSVTIDGVVKDGQQIINGYRVHHTPGHCPGQICLEVDDLLFTADHVLSRITPHQSPASITPFCGLELYLQSLDKVRRLGGVRLALPGHEARLAERIGAIAAHHDRRLGQVLEICRDSKTLLGVSLALFGPREGYTRLLALEEAGAHVEYLFQRGELGIANLDEVSQQANPVIQYETRRGAAA